LIPAADAQKEVNPDELNSEEDDFRIIEQRRGVLRWWTARSLLLQLAQ
jgi:hypothetical protein